MKERKVIVISKGSGMGVILIVFEIVELNWAKKKEIK